MFTTLIIVLVAVLSFAAGRASARPKTPLRDKRGRFVKAPAPRRWTMPTLQLPAFGPQHLAVLAAALAGVRLASMCPAAWMPLAVRLPMPIGVGIARRIITPTRSSRSYRTDLARGQTTSSIWEDWAW